MRENRRDAEKEQSKRNPRPNKEHDETIGEEKMITNSKDQKYVKELL